MFYISICNISYIDYIIKYFISIDYIVLIYKINNSLISITCNGTNIIYFTFQESNAKDNDRLIINGFIIAYITYYIIFLQYTI